MTSSYRRCFDVVTTSGILLTIPFFFWGGGVWSFCDLFVILSVCGATSKQCCYNVFQMISFLPTLLRRCCNVRNFSYNFCFVICSAYTTSLQPATGILLVPVAGVTSHITRREEALSKKVLHRLYTVCTGCTALLHIVIPVTVVIWLWRSFQTLFSGNGAKSWHCMPNSSLVVTLFWTHAQFPFQVLVEIRAQSQWCEHN